MVFDLDKYGTPNVFRWTHEELVRALTTGHNRLVKNPRLVKALKEIKREDFVVDEHKEFAYEDSDLEIGFNQSISKPTTSAYMIELLAPKVGGRVLDIGTGSGWSAALLSYIVGNTGTVLTIEKYQYIADFARTNLRKYTNLANIEVIFKDGYNGLPERAPYDAIHVSAVYDDIPPEIKTQLNVGGRMVAPTKDYNIVLTKRESKNEWTEQIFEGIIFDKIEEGIG